MPDLVACGIVDRVDLPMLATQYARIQGGRRVIEERGYFTKGSERRAAGALIVAACGVRTAPNGLPGGPKTKDASDGPASKLTGAVREERRAAVRSCSIGWWTIDPRPA